MQGNSNQLSADLQRVAHEIEGLLKAKAEEIAERTGEAARQAQTEVEDARKRFARIGKDARKDIARRAEATGEFVKSNPWLAAGIAAAIGLMAGAIAARRE